MHVRLVNIWTRYLLINAEYIRWSSKLKDFMLCTLTMQANKTISQGLNKA